MPGDSQRTYIAIDLKSFYASVECVDRGLDPLATNLVVADKSRTEKTICLAVTPSLKSFGIPGRARLFEVVQRVKEVNADRKKRAPGKRFSGKSTDAPSLKQNPALELDYIVAQPRMARYMEVSTHIFEIYMRHVSPEDTHVYSVDEIFIDATSYLKLYKLSAHDFAMKLVREVLNETGITATAGIGSNMYLAKIAMDIVAKKMPADKDGVRIAELNEQSYRCLLWDHMPITDFWRIGKGYAKRLAKSGMYTMGDVARCSIYNEDLLYKEFGVNAELLIDHAWGWEPCTIKEIKEYKTDNRSISQGQVLSRPYSFTEARLIVREMTDLVSLDLVKRGIVTNQIVLTVGYDIECLTNPSIREKYDGPVVKDHYGRPVPKAAHGSINLSGFTSASTEIINAVTELFERIVNKNLLVRRMYVVANHVVASQSSNNTEGHTQIDMFSMLSDKSSENALKKEKEDDKAQQEAVLAIRNKFGNNAVFKGMDLEEAATLRERNAQVGRHKA